MPRLNYRNVANATKFTHHYNPIVGADPCVRPPTQISGITYINAFPLVLGGGRTHGSAPTSAGNSTKSIKIKVQLRVMVGVDRLPRLS